MSWSGLTLHDGQQQAHLELRVGLDQGVEDVLEHLEPEIRTSLLRVELFGFTGDRRDEVPRGLVAEVHPLTRPNTRPAVKHNDDTDGGQDRSSSHGFTV